MQARHYEPEDTLAFQRLLAARSQPGIADAALDQIFAIGPLGHPGGLLAYRAGAFVHELECTGLRKLTQARALTQFAVNHATTQAHVLRTAIFLVRPENRPMLRFVEALGAVRQSDSGDLLYTLTPKL